MLTVAKLKDSRGDKPYAQPLKVKVCAVGNIQNYQMCFSWNGGCNKCNKRHSLHDTSKLKTLT